jgi:ubiquinol-cytochrome c reductase cytochrome b subunit
MRKVIDWMEHRTGIETAIKSFLYEEIPASSGWHQILGSMAVFAFLVQIFTGILLAFNYAPTPGEAYLSLSFIISEVTGGRLIHGLHHWGASMMIVIVVLHMVQVFIYGAYKPPREATWMAGVILLLLTMAFGLTGYLLPWDNRAYWGTVVTTQIAAQAPVIGPYLQRLLGSDSGVGVMTFARFYAAHVLLLPQIMLLSIVLHVYLVRKHGVAPAAEEIAPPKRFYPEQAMKDTVAIFCGFMVLFVLAIVAKVPLERLADPTDTSYIPRPEWYFLFLFQALKFFKGPLEVIGTMLLPGLAVLMLFLIPLLDRRPVVRLSKRIFAGGTLLLSIAAWGGLTVAAISSTPNTSAYARKSVRPSTTSSAAVSANINNRTAESQPAATASQGWHRFSPAEIAGLGYFRAQNCVACHASGGKKSIGPDLTMTTPAHRIASWLIPHFRNPAQMVPGSAMPPIRLTNAQLSALSAYVIGLTPKTEAIFDGTPAFAVAGATVYQNNNCGACHRLNGMGGNLGPELNGVGSRHDRDWMEKHFTDPQSVSPGSKMPPYKFDEKTMAAISNFLLELK